MDTMKQIARTLKAIERLLALAVVEAGYNGCGDCGEEYREEYGGVLKGVIGWAEGRETKIEQGDE